MLIPGVFEADKEGLLLTAAIAGGDGARAEFVIVWFGLVACFVLGFCGCDGAMGGKGNAGAGSAGKGGGKTCLSTGAGGCGCAAGAGMEGSATKLTAMAAGGGEEGGCRTGGKDRHKTRRPEKTVQTHKKAVHQRNLPRLKWSKESILPGYVAALKSTGFILRVLGLVVRDQREFNIPCGA